MNIVSPIHSPIRSPLTKNMGGGRLIQTGFSFLSASGFTDLGVTNTKTGTTSTRRDSDGNWQAVPTTTVRQHKSEDRDTMTMLVEPAGTNLLTCQKYNVTATTNLTKGGDVAATLSVANDGTTAALIAASELQDLVTNGALFLLDNTGGSGDAYVDFSGAIGSTSASSMSIFAAGGAAGTSGYFGLYDSVGVAENAVQTNIDDTALIRFRQDGTTPDASTDNLRITVPAGKAVYFIVPQLEVFRHCTTPMVSTGTGSVTRNRDDISAALPVEISEKGGVLVKVYHRIDAGADEGYIGLTDSGNGSVNSVGIAISSGRPMVVSNFIEGNSDISAEDIGGIIATRENWCGTYWSTTQMTAVGPNLRFTRETRTGFTVPLQKIWFGKYRQYNGHAAVEIDEVMFLSGKAPTLNDMADVMIPDDAVAVAFAMSQSNARVFGRDETSGSLKNEGERALIVALETYYPTNTPFLLDGAVSGSSMYKDASYPNQWYDFDPGVNGPPLDNFIEMADAFSRNGRIIAIGSNIGETDQGSIDKATWKTYKETIKSIIDSAGYSSIPWFLFGAGSRTTAADSGYNIWREGDRELAEENDDITIAPPTVDLDMDPASSTLHISSAGTVVYAEERLAPYVAALDGVDVSGIAVIGPTVHYIERDGTDIYVCYEFDGDADDFTPATGIEGAVFLDDGVEQSISSHVQENAFTSLITLAGTPSGVEELWYGFGTMDYMVDYDNMIHDNSTNTLPAQLFNETLPFARYSPDQYDNLLIWHDSSVSTTVGQRDDLSGNGHHSVQGTAANQPTINAASQFNKDSLKFDTTNDYMNITSTASLQAVADTMTHEFLIAGTPSAGYKVVFRNDSNGRGFSIQNDSNGGNGSPLNRLFVKVSTDAGSVTTSTRIDGVFDGDIHHCVLRLDNGQIDFFKDGVKTDMGTYDTGNDGFASSSVWQQHAGDNLDDWFFTVYNKALTDDEIAQKYLHAKARWQIT